MAPSGLDAARTGGGVVAAERFAFRERAREGEVDAAVLRSPRTDDWRSAGSAVALGAAGVAPLVGAPTVEGGDRRSSLGHGFAARVCLVRCGELSWRARSGHADFEPGVGKARHQGAELAVGARGARSGQMAACHQLVPGWLWRFLVRC